MDYENKSKEELIKELLELQQKHFSLNESFEKCLNDKEREKLLLEKLITASDELIQFSADSLNYSKILQIIINLSGAKYAAFNIFDDNGLDFTTVALAGIKENIRKALPLLGFDIVNRHWNHDPNRAGKTKLQTITQFLHLHDLVGNVISKSAIYLIEKTFKIEEVFIVKIVKENKTLGDFTLLFKKGETLINNSFVDLYAHQVGLFLDRNKTTSSLLFSESRFRQIVLQSEGVVWEVDTTGLYTYLSPLSLKIYGYTPEQMVGKMHFYDLYPKDKSDEFKKTTLEVFRQKGSFHNLTNLVSRPDGSIKILSTNGIPVIGENGTLIGYLGIDTDVTDRKLAEDLVQQTRRNYETFFNTIKDFLFVLDEQGNIIHANSTVYDRLGYTPEELAGISILMVHPPERRDEAGRIVAEMLSGVSEFCPVPIVTKSGVQIPVETRVSPGFWDGKPVLFGVTKDISKVRLSEEKFSKVFYLNPSACGLSGLDDGKYYEVNDAFYNLFGFDKDEVIGKTASELGILSTETINAIMHKADSNGNVTNAEADLNAKNGDIKHTLLSSENIFIQDKKYRFTVVNDITARRQIENQLTESEYLQRSLLENVAVGIMIIDPETRVIERINTFASSLIGESTENIIGRICHQFICPALEQSCPVCDKGLHVDNSERVLLRADKTTIPVLKTVKVIQIGGKEKLLESFVDISTQKKAEEKLLQSSQKFEAIISASPDGIGMVSLDGKIQLMSKKLATMYGYSFDEIEEIIGKSLFGFIDSINHKMLFDNIQKLMVGKKENKISEYIAVKKDNSRFFVDVNSTVLPDSNGNPASILFVERDITDRKKAEEMLNLKTEELIKVNAEKDKFFSIIAHDLRSPFNGFLGFTQLMLDQIQDMTQTEIHDIALIMRDSAQNLFCFLGNLLEWSQMERGLIPFKPSSFLLIQKITDSVSLIQESINKKEIAVSYDIPNDMLVFADTNMLGGIIRNLVSNAAKFSPKGGKITIAARPQPDNTIEFSIKDTGIGMTQDIIDCLFRIDNKKKRLGTDGEPSTGLGLLICKDFIEKHGGKLWAESEPGKGSVFYFTIPSKTE